MDTTKTTKMHDGNEMFSLERQVGSRTITVNVVLTGYSAGKVNVYVASGRRCGSGRTFSDAQAAVAGYKKDAVKSAILDAVAACELN